MSTVFLLDMDGTLLDTSVDLAVSISAARAVLGHSPVVPEQIEPHIGYGLGHLLRGLIPEASSSEIERAREAFVVHALEFPCVHTQPYPGVIAFLKNPPGRLGLVTNKPLMFLEPILDVLGWRAYFDVILAGDSLPERKPSGVPLQVALERMGARPEQAVFIGDTEVDSLAAMDAGIRFVAVAWGRVAKDSANVIDGFDQLGARTWC